MKRVYITCLCIFCNFIVFAQDSLNISSINDDFLKASKKRFLTELNINPFKGELSLNNTLNQVKVRYFVSNLTALRLAVAANVKNESIDNSNVYGTNPFFNKEKKKTSTIGLNFGVEKHFTGTKRLSPYIGAEVAFAVKSSSHSLENDNSKTEIKGAWSSTTYYSNSAVVSYSERGFTRFGLNALAGFDFYLAKNFYFGYELNFGLSNTKFKNIDFSSTYKSGSTSKSKDTTDEDEKEFAFGANLINGIRLGFVF